MLLWASGGIGRRARLKIWFSQGSEGSIPSSPTNIVMTLKMCHFLIAKIHQMYWWILWARRLFVEAKRFNDGLANFFPFGAFFVFAAESDDG